MPGLVLIAIAHVEDIRGARGIVAPLRERGAIDRLKTRAPGESADSLAGALTSDEELGPAANRVAPRSSVKPSRSQPRVPFLSAYTSLGTPAAMRLVAPKIPRVRDMQFTTTFVVGRGTRSSKQRSIWPAGASMLPGMFPAWYSRRGRLSMSTQSSPPASARWSSLGVMNFGRA